MDEKISNMQNLFRFLRILRIRLYLIFVARNLTVLHKKKYIYIYYIVICDKWTRSKIDKGKRS